MCGTRGDRDWRMKRPREYGGPGGEIADAAALPTVRLIAENEKKRIESTR